VSVADRSPVVVFAATLKLAAPSPVPLPVTTVTHPALLVAAHAQPAVVVTATLPVPPAAVNACEVGAMLKEHGAPACVTVNVCPATVSVADRALVVMFAATLKAAVPLPVPLAVTAVSQPALLVAAHAQPSVDVTATLPVPPAAANACEVCEILNEHPTPACVTMNVWPATVRLPLRCVVAVLAATAKETAPLPMPVPPALTVNQGALAAAVQAHPAPALTATVPLPPAEANDCDTGEMAGAHGAVKLNVFEGRLGDLPPGPTADTRVS